MDIITERECLACRNKFIPKLSQVYYRKNKSNKEIIYCSKKCSQKNRRYEILKKIDPKEAVRLYTENKESCSVIGKMIGAKRSFIERLLEDNNVPRRNNREASIERMKKRGPQKFNTSIELSVAALLKCLNIDYETQKVFGYWAFDFYLPDYDLFIECDGDYWHGNPKKYTNSELNSTQRRTIGIGKNKDAFITKKKRKLIRFWENDINNDIDLIKLELEKQTNIGNLENYGSSG